MHHRNSIGDSARHLPELRSSFARRRVVVPLLAAALLGAAAAPTVAAEPAAGTKGPPPSGRTTSLLQASGDANMITLRLECHDDGRVTVATTAPKRRLGSTRFVCVGNRAVARLRMPAQVARSARTRESINAMATVVSGAERTRFELKTPRQGGKRQLASASSFSIPRAWCTGVGFTMSMDNTARFDAAWGETVYWRPVGWDVDLYNGAGVLRYGAWKSHRAVPGDGMFLIYPSGYIEFTWTVTQSAGYVASRYGVAVWPHYEVYTARGGSRLLYLGATSGYGYGETVVKTCNVPYPAGY